MNPKDILRTCKHVRQQKGRMQAYMAFYQALTGFYTFLHLRIFGDMSDVTVMAALSHSGNQSCQAQNEQRSEVSSCSSRLSVHQTYKSQPNTKHLDDEYNDMCSMQESATTHMIYDLHA